MRLRSLRTGSVEQLIDSVLRCRSLSMLIGQGSMTFSSPLFIGPVVAGVFATALLVWHECMTSHPLFARELFANRQLLVAFAASFLNMLSYFLIFAFQYSCAFLLLPSSRRSESVRLTCSFPDIQVEYQHLDPMIHGFIKCVRGPSFLSEPSQANLPAAASASRARSRSRTSPSPT